VPIARTISLNVAGPSIRYVPALPVRRDAFGEIAPEMMADHRVGSRAVDAEESLEEESPVASSGATAIVNVAP